MTDATRWLAVLALTFNAFTWGVSWWPFRQLEARGLHALWSTALVYTVAVVAITLWRRVAWGQLLRTPSLWWLVLASGTTNASFNWAVTIGDVVRVVLLFYLMPLWAVLLARLLLGEPLTRIAALRVAMALAGAAIVLWPGAGVASAADAADAAGLAGAAGASAAAGSGAMAAAMRWPVPHTLAEWLGVLGGFSFALNNVLLRREAHQPAAARALAMFGGGALVSLVLATALAGSGAGAVPLPPAPSALWVAGGLALGMWFLLANLALQYGASRLPANVTAVVMITEVLFASVSALALGAGTLSPALALGGGLIVGAALLATRG
jgi:drug/metabolite transporter (DMT)-like permease